MANHSKVAAPAAEGFVELIRRALLGSPSRKAFSGVILAIIAYLIYAKNKKSATDSIKLAERRGGEKKVLVGLCSAVARVMWMQSS